MTIASQPSELQSRAHHTSMPRLYLIRHGETAWTLTGQHTGLTDIPLTEHGRETAKRLVPVLTRLRFDLVLTSPLQRARETCELAGLGERTQVDTDLVEWDYGDYEGLTSKQILALSPGWFLFRDGCPGGERPADVGARVDRVIARARSLQGHVALFAHGHLFKVLAARWLGLSVASGSQFILDTATLSILSYYRGVPALKRWNARLKF
ncbi:MAG TPA: histidine phosphatase family protein [Vicinamibacterales bacterium]|jgi:probable phosphoglycerate mutase